MIDIPASNELYGSFIIRDGLCYALSATQIRALDTRVKPMQVVSCKFIPNELKHITMKFNMADDNDHLLIVASNKIDIFDTRDLTRPVMSSPYLVSPNIIIINTFQNSIGLEVYSYIPRTGFWSKVAGCGAHARHDQEHDLEFKRYDVYIREYALCIH